jgi:hypothetical protein
MPLAALTCGGTRTGSGTERVSSASEHIIFRIQNIFIQILCHFPEIVLLQTIRTCFYTRIAVQQRRQTGLTAVTKIA